MISCPNLQPPPTALWIPFLLAAACLPALRAQTPSLDAYVEEGFRQNRQVAIRGLETAIAERDQASIRAGLLPSARFNADYMRAGGGRTIDIPAGDLINPAHRAINGILERDVLPTDVANVREQLLTDDFHDTYLEVAVPLLQPQARAAVRAQSARVAQSRAAEATERNRLRYDIQVAYYDHHRATLRRRALDSARAVLRETLRVGEKLVASGVETRDVVYAAEARLSALDAETRAADGRVQQTRRQFNLLLGRPAGSGVDLDVAPPTEAMVLERAALAAAALARRSELDGLRQATQAATHQLRGARAYRVPSITLGARAGFQGFGYGFGDDQDYFLATVNLSIPLFAGGANEARVARAQLELQRLGLEAEDLTARIDAEARAAADALATASALRDARRSARVQAAESLRQVEGGFRQNSTRLLELEAARLRLSDARLAEALAAVDVAAAAAALQYTTQSN